MHAVATTGAAWMRRRRVIYMLHSTHSCTISADRRTYRPRADIVMFAECADMNTSPQDRSGGISDRPGAPTDRPSRHILTIDIDI